MEKYLRHCLDSLLIDEEGMKQLEVLVINDGSKDSSSLIAYEYQAKYPETFRVIDKENGNYGSCINRGLKEATGKYIKVLDADDSYDPKLLSEYLKLLQKYDVDLILNTFDIVNNKGYVVRSHNYRVPTLKILEFEKYAAELFDLEMHSVAYNRLIFQELRYHQTEGISYTDQEWVFLPVTNVRDVLFFDKPLYKYLVGREGQTVNPKVAARSLAHKQKGLFSMMEMYRKANPVCSRQKQIYLQNKLIIRASYMYEQLLLFLHKNAEAIQLDNIIKEKCPDVWSLCDTIVFRNYPFVKEWRNSNYRVQQPITIKIYLLAKKIKYAFQSLYQK